MKRQVAAWEQYWVVVKKRFLLMVLVAVVVAGVALVIAKQVEPTQEVHFSYVVSLSARDEAAGFKFEGYYGLQAIDLFTTTLAKWITTPEVLVAAYQDAELQLASDDPRQLTRVVRAEKVAPQLVTVTVRGANREATERLADGLQHIMEKNVSAYHDQGVPAVQFSVVPTEPWTGVVRLSVPIVVAATFIFTFLVALNGVLLFESLKNMDKQ